MPGPKAKKATPTKAAKSSGNRYEYSTIANTSVTGGDRHHAYGVIVDATFPYKVSKDRFVCSLKIVDSSLKKNEYASVVIYASRFEDLPIVHRLGDIIRVHRATMRLYDDRRQFNVNVQFNGAWALFSTDAQSALGVAAGGNAPVAHSGKRASFEKHEAGMLAALRRWASGFFAANCGCVGCIDLKAASKAEKDFDCCARITQIHEFDEYTNEIRLRDNTGNSWYTLCTKLKFPHLRSGSSVYIRSVTNASGSGKNVLGQSHYTNIMTFIGGSKSGKNYANVANDSAADKAALSGSNTGSAVIVSAVAGKYAGMATTSLRDLFHRDSTLSGNTFRVHCQVTAVNGGDCVKNGHWHAELMCKDASTAGGSNQYRLLCYSQDGLGSKFFGSPAATPACRTRVAGHVANMTRFNSFVDAVVERKNGFYFIKDTHLIH